MVVKPIERAGYTTCSSKYEGFLIRKTGTMNDTLFCFTVSMVMYTNELRATGWMFEANSSEVGISISTSILIVRQNGSFWCDS
jgi:hypothetical protein